MPQNRTINLILTFFVIVFLGFATVGGFLLKEKNMAKNKPFLAASAIYGPEVKLEPKILPVVASKNGTRYYLPSCGAAARIKPENRIVFANWQKAEEAGLTPAQNCQELTDYLNEF